jgi:hypothetical protein
VAVGGTSVLTGVEARDYIALVDCNTVGWGFQWAARVLVAEAESAGD